MPFSAIALIRYVFVLLVGASLCVAGRASTPLTSSTPAKAPQTMQQADFSKEALVIEKMTTRIREEADGTGTIERYVRIRVQSDAGVKAMTTFALPYSTSTHSVDIDFIRVIKPDGSIVVTPGDNAQDILADFTHKAPIYSDIHQKRITVKNLGVGDILEYKVTSHIKPEIPGQFWYEFSFEKNGIILDEQLDLDLPAEKTVTVASSDTQSTIRETQGRKLYHLAGSNLTRLDPSKTKPAKRSKPSVQVTTFTSWDQVGAWYWSLQKDQLAVTPTIQARAAELTKGLTTDDEKIKAIFNAVAQHPHSVGLSFEIGRYQPHQADQILSSEYADTKDKHTLLAALLKAAGIPAWPVLISNSSELDPAVPSPAQFNQVITVVPRTDAGQTKLIWMDATAEVTPVGTLYASLRNKQALAIPLDKPAYLERTPADLPYPQSWHSVVTGKISDQGELTGRIEQTIHGDFEFVLLPIFRQTPQSQWKQAMQQYSRAFGFDGEAQQPEVSPLNQTDKPLHFAYNYTREKHPDWEYQPFNPFLPLTGWEAVSGAHETKPAEDLYLGTLREMDFQSTVKLPAGWSLLAKNGNQYSDLKQIGTDIKEDWAEFHSKYSLANGTFTAERRLMTKKDKIPLADWDKYMAFREAIYSDTNLVKQLTIASPPESLPVFMASGPPPTTSELHGAVYGIKADGSIHPASPGELSGGGLVGLSGLAGRADANDPTQKRFALLKQLDDAMIILAASPRASEMDRGKAVSSCRNVLHDVEKTAFNLPLADPDSLDWSQMLVLSWTCLGWNAQEAGEQSTAETYLRSAWQISHESAAGYQLARVLEAKGDKAGAAHLYELAYVSPGWFSSAAPNGDLRQLISNSYTKLTGKPMTATLLDHGAYKGSLSAELDSMHEFSQYISSTKLDGEAVFSVAYEEGKLAKATFLFGDKAFASLATALESTRLPSYLPAASKARLLREVKLICSPDNGCDAHLYLSGAVQTPKAVVADGTPPSTPDNTKTTQ